MKGYTPAFAAGRTRRKGIAVLAPVSFFLIEVFAFFFLRDNLSPLEAKELWPLAFGFFWALLLWSLCRMIPGKGGKILYGILYFVAFLYTGIQTGYYLLFGEMMWLSDFRYASEGSDYFSVLLDYPITWWLGLITLLALGVITLVYYPRRRFRWGWELLSAGIAVASILGCVYLPNAVFLSDKQIRYSGSDYGRAQASEAAYTNMFNTHRLYQVCGIYQTGVKDLYRNEIFPLSPAYASRQKAVKKEIDEYFSQRGAEPENEMTGLLKGKNVILVLMESMDDWMLGEHTPTINRMMEEGICFQNFYTPAYGGVRTFNSEFCINTGSFLSSQGGYAFDYVTNHFRQSLASLLTKRGYSAKTFHYNDPSFYSRGVFSPAMGYEEYVHYGDYVTEEDKLYDDCVLLDDPEIYNLFFRGTEPRLNFIITRSAHLSYVYNEVLSHWGLKRYPEFRGLTGHEEADCAYLKARLVDDLFARLVKELEKRDELDNTVIVAVTDHYTYGVKDTEMLLERSGVTDDLLLEKTPCFIWGGGVPAVTVEKTGNTSDVLPTVLNLLGVKTDYRYIGHDMFDESYPGYALFSDGSWISGDRAYNAGTGEYLSLPDAPACQLSDSELDALVSQFVRVNNQILETDYYK